MTVYRLHKLLGELISKGYARTEVCVDKSKCTHPLESDGVVFIPTTNAEIQVHEMMDDDGGFKTRKDGQTVIRTALVIEAKH